MQPEIIHVAIAVIYNAKNQILIARRASHQHQGGMWEFPGGKVENGENSQQALIREIQEEVGIEVESSLLIKKIIHQYDNKKVCLDVYAVKNWSGKASGMEGQPIKWVEIDDLNHYKFPKANNEIISLIQTVSSA